MTSPVWERASCIDDLATKAGALVDSAELYPSSARFSEIRAMLRSIIEEAAEIMATEKYDSMPEYLISFDPGEIGDEPLREHHQRQDERTSE